MRRKLEALDATLSRFEQGDSPMLEVLETLLGEEFTTRETRRIRMALKTARLGSIKMLAGYDFSFQPSPDRDRIMRSRNPGSSNDARPFTSWGHPARVNRTCP